MKFCPLHLESNTIHRFKSVTPEVSSGCPLLYKLQAATSLTGYDRVLDEVRAAYPVPLRHEDGTTELVADYLEKIHPTSWTRVGNYIHSEAERDSFLNRWPNTPTHGVPLPLFGTRTTSANEGENNTLNWNQPRLEDVLLLSFCERFMSVCNRHRKQATTRLNGAFNLTPRAKQHVDAEIATIPSVSVQHSNENEYYVDETNESTDNKTYTRPYHVDISLGSCIRCPVREHHQVPCRHLLATIMHARGQDPITKDELERFFPQAYLVQEYAQAFQPVAIALPLERDRHDKDDIQPPPQYRQTGRTRASSKTRDRVNKTKRHKNKGERSSSSKVVNTSDRPDTPGNLLSVLQDQVQSFFGVHLTGAVQKQRRMYRCSECNTTGHNRAISPGVDVEREGDDVPVQPGAYTFGGSPFVDLQVDHLYNS